MSVPELRNCIYVAFKYSSLLPNLGLNNLSVLVCMQFFPQQAKAPYQLFKLEEGGTHTHVFYHSFWCHFWWIIFEQSITSMTATMEYIPLKVNFTHLREVYLKAWCIHSTEGGTERERQQMSKRERVREEVSLPPSSVEDLTLQLFRPSDQTWRKCER